MSLRSGELQNLLPRTTEVGRIQRAADEHQYAHQAARNEAFSREVQRQTQQVESPPGPQDARVQEAGRERRRRDRRGRRKERSSRMAVREEGRGQRLDVRI